MFRHEKAFLKTHTEIARTKEAVSTKGTTQCTASKYTFKIITEMENRKEYMEEETIIRFMNEHKINILQ